MKKLFFFIVCLFACSVAATELKAQSAPVVYKDWTLLGESKTHVDVSYRVVKCSTTPQIHLSIFNESPSDQLTEFELELIDVATGKKEVKQVSFSLKAANIYKVECDSDAALNALKIDLPAGFDPSNTSVKISFKQ